MFAVILLVGLAIPLIVGLLLVGRVYCSQSTTEVAGLLIELPGCTNRISLFLALNHNCTLINNIVGLDSDPECEETRKMIRERVGRIRVASWVMLVAGTRTPVSGLYFELLGMFDNLRALGV